LLIDTSGVPEHLETITAGTTVKVADKAVIVLQALATADEQPLPGNAAAAAAVIPTVPPVPVPIRA
jgi:hypothetical protein